MGIVIPGQVDTGQALNFIIMLKRPPIEIKGRIVWVSTDRTRGGIRFERLLCGDWDSLQAL
jgi:hypothetical protein